MKIQEYAALRDNYKLPAQMEGAGNVLDKESGHVLAIGFNTHRDVYKELGYICDPDAPEVFHACVCAVLETVYQMPLVKTVLLTPEMAYEKICGNEKPTEEIERYTYMALCALNEGLRGYVNMRNEKREKAMEETAGETPQ